MAFLFKSKKAQDRSLPSRDGASGSQGSIQSATARIARDEKSHRATPTGSMHSLDNDSSIGSPDQGPGILRRGGSIDQSMNPNQGQGQGQSDLPFRNGPPVSNSNASLFPWSQRRLTYTSSQPSPFPRYGAAVNSVSSKEGDIYMMGGLINSSTVKGDLWMIEAGGNMACYPLSTTAEGPGPRVGHASLLVGNAFIVYGGDTKIDETDVLDETLYLLNTSTRQWSRALPAGIRPSGRYGHSLNILGSKIYIFGGQVEGFFMNDLAAFDLNQLQMPNNRWEILLHGENSPKAPAARTNHTMITFDDKMYLFGGTNGFQWFNDVWCYDPVTNKWSQLDCRGYIPCPREGHAASLVGDVMYVFGGRTEEGTDLGDLAAFKITSQRWYTFQNMGPSPSPRSGHSMTTVGKSIIVLGGEPSAAAAAINDLGILYVLDTTKIQYPNDSQQQGVQRLAGSRRPSTSDAGSVGRQQPSREGSNGPSDLRRTMASPTNMGNAAVAMNGHKSPTHPPESASATNGTKNPRSAPSPSPIGPPPQGPTPAKPVADASGVARVRGSSIDRTNGPASPKVNVTQLPPTREVETESPIINGRRTPPQQTSPSLTNDKRGASENTNKAARQPELATDAIAKTIVNRPASPPPPTRQPSNPLSRRSSGRSSQTVSLLKELDSARNRNAWYASELELARKAGFSPNAASGSSLDNKAAETFDDEDRPLVEALLAMRTELANVQSSVDKQAVITARQIAEAEKQRDAAISEAVYAKARLAAQLNGSTNNSIPASGDRDELGNRKLASALGLQKDLQAKLDAAKGELEAERKARQLADDTANVAQQRLADLESYKQQASAEVEHLKAELHVVQREARETSVTCGEAVAALALLKVEKDDFASKYQTAVGTSKEHADTFESLRAAMTASEDAKAHLESRLENERAEREKVEGKLNSLKFEHEARTAELVAATQRLRDAEEMAEKHANEARTHRQAVLAGLDKVSARDLGQASNADADRITALQNQVNASNVLVKKYQQEADIASDKLRSAEERIAGLEQYQEQSSRDGVSVRRQLQSALRETQSLQANNTELRNQLAAQQLEANALSVQHTALKDILSDRGISPTGAVRSRGLNSPRGNSPDLPRLRELESQLASATAAHEETKQSFALQAHEAETAYREKLAQLESDYTSAVHYVKGTEKMLKQLTEQLSRYKAENARLKSDMSDLEEQLQTSRESAGASDQWASERSSLEKKVNDLEAELRSSAAGMEAKLQSIRGELKEVQRQRDTAESSNEAAEKKMAAWSKELEHLQAENAQLEQRAADAEQKVSLLLDQVEHSVDNYRRQSRQLPDGTSVNGGAQGHTRQESSEVESVYEGSNVDGRNSVALDNLASELETLRSHWEATNKNYRLSTNFDFETPSAKKEGEPTAGMALSESLADWRKRLDTEDSPSDNDKTKRI